MDRYVLQTHHSLLLCSSPLRTAHDCTPHGKHHVNSSGKHQLLGGLESAHVEVSITGGLFGAVFFPVLFAQTTALRLRLAQAPSG